jgi:hypothetical protein
MIDVGGSSRRAELDINFVGVHAPSLFEENINYFQFWTVKNFRLFLFLLNLDLN